MKNLILIFYFIAYASGIGTMTLAGFYYYRTKTTIVKYLIMIDLFLTIMLSIDVVSIFANLNRIPLSGWLWIFFKVSFIIADIGLVYYVSLSVYSIINITLTRRHKALYFLISISLSLSGIVMLYSLYIKDLITSEEVMNSASVLSTVLISIGCIFYMIVLIVHWNNMNQMLKKFIKVILITTFVISPASILTNVISYWYYFSIPIAFSPVIYIIFNIVGMFFAARYLMLGHTIPVAASVDAQSQSPEQGPSAEAQNPEGKSSAEALSLGQKPSAEALSPGRKPSVEAQSPGRKPSTEELVNQYKLTERELEIVLLVAEGRSNQEIGDRLFISPNTVRNHIYNVYQKMNIRNRYELISIMSSARS